MSDYDLAKLLLQALESGYSVEVNLPTMTPERALELLRKAAAQT